MNASTDLFFRRKRVLPVLMSSELGECGLVSLAMVANYLGHDCDLNSLRQRFSVSIIGTNLRGLMKIASCLGMSSRAIRVELDALENISLPALIHWDMNHFVVLQSVTKKRLTIHDPMRGRVSYSLKEFSNHFTGIALEVAKADDFQKIRDRKAFRFTDLFSHISGYKSSIIYVFMLAIALQIISLLLPFQLQLVVDKAIGSKDAGVLTVIAISFGILTIMNVVISTLRDWTLQLLGSQFVFQVAGNVFRHLIRLPASFFEKRHLGDILSRLGSVRQIQDLLTQGLLSAILDGAMALLSGIALSMYSPKLAAIVFCSVFICLIFTICTYPALQKQSEKVVTVSANEQSFSMESMRGVVPIKLMGAEAIRESSWRNLHSRNFNEQMQLGRINQYVRFFEDIILNVQYIIVLYIGALDIINTKGMTLGMLLAFLALRTIFVERFKILIARGLQFSTVFVYINRLGDFLIEEPEVKAQLAITNEVRGNIIFENVGFRYGITDPLILNGINLQIKQGEFIAIVGPSGGGKTTFLKILLGLQIPTDGRVFLEGQLASPDIWEMWRSSVGVVRQDDQLFSGTLAENIAFFDPDLDMQRVIEAAKAAHIHNEIDKMPTKYLTPVGDMGSSLSGGQKQRVLLARALYRSPKILVLDEGTANLDLETEELIADVIGSMNITRIVVSHRPALIARATKVVKIEHTKLILNHEFCP
jgi:ATP-binding cassette, subfamily B, bacterial CvaB/MchF/RaxB